VERDDAGRSIYVGLFKNVIVCIVVALDDLDLVIAIFDRRN
jgi:hypothetical protein